MLLENLKQIPNTADGDEKLRGDEYIVLLRRVFGLPFCNANGLLRMVPLEVDDEP